MKEAATLLGVARASSTPITGMDIEFVDVVWEAALAPVAASGRFGSTLFSGG